MKLIIKKECPNCKYLIEQLKKLNLLDKIEIVEDNSARVVPALETDDGIEPVMGNVYGLLKLVMHMKRNGLIEDKTAS